MNTKIPALNIGDLKVDVPIVQGGMGVGISLAGLAGAVAQQGGIGVIATPGVGQFEPDCETNLKAANDRALRKEIVKAKEIAGGKGAIGVNVMVALSDFDGLVQASVEAGADILFLGAGLPVKLPKFLTPEKINEIDTKFVPIVSSAKAAILIMKSWEKRYKYMPDAISLEGPLAGGHLGFKKEQITDPEFAVEKLLPEVIAAVQPYREKYGKEIPIIVGGGIFTGQDIHKIMELGAAGVQMGTRFAATVESDASDEFKQAYLDAKKEDIVLINSPVGLPGRAINGPFLKRIAAGVKEKFKCPWKCLRTCDFKKVPYCIGDALANAKIGNLEQGYAFAGANAYRINEIISVKELIDTLKAEYAACKQG